jgi:hypothetical protein
MNYARHPEDPAELADALREENKRLLAEWLDELSIWLIDEFPGVTDDEIAGVLARVEPIAKSYGEAQVQSIVRKRLH